MKIGLLRHFKVKAAYPEKFWMRGVEVEEWLDRYDECEDLEVVDLQVGDWDKCYSSPLYRALRTAENVFEGEIITLKELEEFKPRLSRNLKLPFFVWAMYCRFGLKKQKSKFAQKIREVLPLLIQGKVLVVSHYFVMQALERMLVAEGWKKAKEEQMTIYLKP
jgi:hypothetical protein